MKKDKPIVLFPITPGCTVSRQLELCGDLFDKDLKGHGYAIQVTTDAPQWGGLSGCTFDEARSWKKIAPDASTVTVNSDAPIALPIMVSALAEGSAKLIEGRKPPSFDISGVDIAIE